MIEGITRYLSFSMAVGFTEIANIIGSSYLANYPVEFLVGTALFIGIAMVAGTAFLVLAEPECKEKPKRPFIFLNLDPHVKARRTEAAC